MVPTTHYSNHSIVRQMPIGPTACFPNNAKPIALPPNGPKTHLPVSYTRSRLISLNSLRL